MVFGGWTTENPQFTNVGEYTVYYYVVSKNYEADPITGYKAVNITKADSEFTAPTANESTYNGEEQELVTAGESEDGTIVYAISESADTAPEADAYSDEIPTGVNAGTSLT